jgi:hypothetical protein
VKESHLVFRAVLHVPHGHQLAQCSVHAFREEAALIATGRWRLLDDNLDAVGASLDHARTASSAGKAWTRKDADESERLISPPFRRGKRLAVGAPAGTRTLTCSDFKSPVSANWTTGAGAVGAPDSLRSAVGSGASGHDDGPQAGACGPSSVVRVDQAEGFSSAVSALGEEL